MSPSPFIVVSYHSLVIAKEEFPSEELDITAWTEDGLIMAARYKKYKHIQVGYSLTFLFMMRNKVVTLVWLKNN